MRRVRTLYGLKEERFRPRAHVPSLSNSLFPVDCAVDAEMTYHVSAAPFLIPWA